MTEPDSIILVGSFPKVHLVHASSLDTSASLPSESHCLRAIPILSSNDSPLSIAVTRCSLYGSISGSDVSTQLFDMTTMSPSILVAGVSGYGLDSLYLSSEAPRVVVGGFQGVQAFHSETGEIFDLNVFPPPRITHRVLSLRAWSPNVVYVAGEMDVDSYVGSISTFDVLRDGQIRSEYNLRDGTIRDISPFESRGLLFAVGSRTSTCRVFSRDSLEIVDSISLPSPASSLFCSSESNQLIIALDDDETSTTTKTIEIRDSRNLTSTLNSFELKDCDTIREIDSVSSVSSGSSPPSLFVSGSRNGKAQLWNSANGVVIAESGCCGGEIWGVRVLREIDLDLGVRRRNSNGNGLLSRVGGGLRGLFGGLGRRGRREGE